MKIENDKQNVQAIESKLNEFGVEAKVVDCKVGPALVQYELQLGSGVKVTEVSKLQPDLSLALGGVPISISIKPVVSISVPRQARESVNFGSLVAGDYDQVLPVILGKDAVGEKLVFDLSQAPHLLVAGATGSGKSVFIHSLLCSLLDEKVQSNEVQLVLVDPKGVELSAYSGIKNLWINNRAITEATDALGELNLLAVEMARRYSLLAQQRVRNIKEYNLRTQFGKLPYIVVVIDEFADLIMAESDLEQAVCKLAQKSRAAGIHLVLATQRPSVDVVTGLIKANFPTRVAFKVSSKVDSRVVLDVNGAEDLIGKGDALLLSDGELTRFQGAFCSEDYVDSLVSKLRVVSEPVVVESTELSAELADVVEILCRFEKLTLKTVQTELRVGPRQASAILGDLVKHGFVGRPDSQGVWTVLS